MNLIPSCVLGFILCLTTISAAPEIVPKVIVEDHNVTLLEEWIHMEKKVRELTNLVFRTVLPTAMEIAYTANVSASCMKDTIKLIAGLRDIRVWAIRFLDATSKFLDGAIVGTAAGFGNFRECLDTEVTHSKRSDEVLFRGQYCTLEFRPPLPPNPEFKLFKIEPELENFTKKGSIVSEFAKYTFLFKEVPLRMGICVPSGCSRADLNSLIKPLAKQISIDAEISRCEVKEENQYTNLVISIISVMSFFVLLVLVATMLDVYAYYKQVKFERTGLRVLLAFSFFTNFRKWSNTETSSQTLCCLHGIRFISITWVVLTHSFIPLNLSIMSGMFYGLELRKEWAFQVITNATPVVDTFLLIGGLLVCYVTKRLMTLGGHKFSVTVYIFHRLFRIWPVYGIVLMFTFLANLIGSGPIFHEMIDKLIYSCGKNWWANMLFINNFYDTHNMCFLHTWYLSCDFQLYLVALLVLIPLLKWPRTGIILNVVFILASMIASAIIVYINNYPPTLIILNPTDAYIENVVIGFFFRPYYHGASYFIGTLVGYLLAVKPDLKIPRRLQILGWCAAICINMSVLYGARPWNSDIEPNFWELIFYSSCSRTAWSLGISWVIVCCCTGHGGFVNTILTWKFWIPLSRITFPLYLIHFMVQTVTIASLHNNIQSDPFVAVWINFGHLMISLGCAFAISMVIEAPMLAIEKILLPREDNLIDNVKPQEDKKIVESIHVIPRNGHIAQSKENDVDGITHKEPFSTFTSRL